MMADLLIAASLAESVIDNCCDVVSGESPAHIGSPGRRKCKRPFEEREVFES
jgi:hypothetical protein